VNNEYRERFAEGGLIASGVSKDGNLVEIMELRDHPFFVGVQFHPEFRSRPTRPHPLFRDFVGAAKAALPEGAQRSLPLGNGNGHGSHAVPPAAADRVLVVAHE
jgi:CTP synthase